MRWKAIVFVHTITLAVTVTGGCSQSPQAKETRYLEKGKKEFQKKDYAVAIRHFKNAIQAQSRDAEPQRGLAYLALNATELNPKHTGVQLKVAALMASSRSKEVLEEAQKRSQDVLKIIPEDVKALNILALAELRLGNPRTAEAQLEQALRKSPDNLRSSVALAQGKAARKDIAGAEEVLKQADAQAPRSPEPGTHLGGFYLALGRNAEAEQQFGSALQMDRKHGPALLELAALQARAGQTHQAEQTYRRVSALPDKQYHPIHALYLFQSGKQKEAIAEFEKLHKDDPADRNERTDLVRTYLAQNRVDDSEKGLSAALKKNGLDVDSLLYRSRPYLASQKYAEAEADLNQILHCRRESAEAHFLLAKVQQGRGKTSIQQQELGEALRLDPTYLPARLELAQLLTSSGGAQSVLQLLARAPQEQKGIVGLKAQRNWALLALSPVADAQKGVGHLLTAGKVPDAMLQGAILKLNQKDNAGSRSLLTEVLRQKPGDTRALTLLMQSYSAEKQTSAGVQRVREYAAQRASLAPVQQFLGQLLLRNGDRQGTRQVFEAAKAADPGLVRADLGSSELDMNEGKIGRGKKEIASIVASHPDNLEGQLFLAQLDGD
jgi:tetratricopeptide (TPR) repeat protein